MIEAVIAEFAPRFHALKNQILTALIADGAGMDANIVPHPLYPEYLYKCLDCGRSFRTPLAAAAEQEIAAQDDEAKSQ